MAMGFVKADETKEEQEQDAINPKHYASSCSLECIDTIEIGFGLNNTAVFCVMNAYKYCWRFKNKNGIEDLYKAEWYINRFFDIVKRTDNTELGYEVPKELCDKAMLLREIIWKGIRDYGERQ